MFETNIVMEHIAIMLFLSCTCSLKFRSIQNIASRNTLQAIPRHLSSSWWESGLKFGCTACGKCCKVEGEVWMDANEMVAAADFLQLEYGTFMENYVEQVMSGWVKIKNKHDIENESDECIFLGLDGKSCSIYRARPMQCRTYPFWPRLFSNESTWLSEAVVPDEYEGKHWDPSNGGCEGINHENATIVPKLSIARNLELYGISQDAFPFTTTGDDKNRLLVKASIIKVYFNKYNLRRIFKNFFLKNLYSSFKFFVVCLYLFCVNVDMIYREFFLRRKLGSLTLSLSINYVLSQILCFLLIL